jgi:O-antigen/teichoic acid export membrane protein
MIPQIFKYLNSSNNAIIVQMGFGYLNKILIMFQGIILIPLYTSYLGNRLYGLWLATGGAIGWIGLFDLGIGTLIIQRVSYLNGKKKEKEIGDFFINALLFYIPIVVILTLVVIILSYNILLLFDLNLHEEHLLRICILIAGGATIIEIINNGLRGFSQALLKPLFSSLSMVLFRLFSIIISISLLKNGYGLWALPIGMLFSSMPVLLTNILLCISLLKGKINKWTYNRETIKALIKVSPLHFLSRSFASILSNIEPTVIAFLIKPETAVIYVITKKAATMAQQLLSVLIASVFPSFVKKISTSHKTDEKNNYIANIVSLSFFFGLLSFGTYNALNMSFVNIWIGSSKFLGQDITLAISVGAFLYFMFQVGTNIIFGSGKIILTSKIILAEAVIRLVFIIGLVKSIGIIGYPIGLILSTSTMYLFLIPKLIGDGNVIKKAFIFFKIFSIILIFILSNQWNSLFPNIMSWSLFVLNLFIVSIIITIILSFIDSRIYRILWQKNIEKR